ncbi:MAG: glucuronyl hydrolase [Arenicella sp.]
MNNFVNMEKLVQTPLTNEELQLTLEILLHRIDDIDDQCDGSFPIYSIGQQNQWRTSSGGSWLGGFWAACWWLKAYLTKSKKDAATALELCKKLENKLSINTINRSMIFWYGASLGSKWHNDPTAHRISIEASRHLHHSFDNILQAIPLGKDMGGGPNADKKVSIDTLASTLQLLMYSQDIKASQTVQRHLDTLINTLSEQTSSQTTGRWYSEAHYRSGKLKPIGIAGNWSRGQAWAMLALSKAAYLWGSPYLEQAQHACEYWESSRWFHSNSIQHHQRIPLNDLDQTNGLHDPSSLLVSSLALLLLNQLQENDHYLQLAKKQIAVILRSTYFSATNTDNNKQGIFWGCCMTTQYPNEQSLVESPWGIFFLASCLSILLGHIQPYDV